MLSPCTTVRYTERNKVLYLLYRLMRKELYRRERTILFLHCGYGREGPASFCEIAALLSMPSAQCVRECYMEAIQKIRAAIPDSELQRYIFYIAVP